MYPPTRLRLFINNAFFFNISFPPFEPWAATSNPMKFIVHFTSTAKMSQFKWTSLRRWTFLFFLLFFFYFFEIVQNSSQQDQTLSVRHIITNYKENMIFFFFEERSVTWNLGSIWFYFQSFFTRTIRSVAGSVQEKMYLRIYHWYF